MFPNRFAYFVVKHCFDFARVRSGHRTAFRALRRRLKARCNPPVICPTSGQFSSFLPLRAARKRPPARKLRVRANTNFMSLFKLIWVVQSPQQIFFAWLVGQIIFRTSRHPVSIRGALAIVTNVGMGCGRRDSIGARTRSQGGLRLVSDRRRADERCCSGRQSRVVLAPVAGVKLAEVLRARPGPRNRQSADDGDKTNSSPGRARYKPLKPLRREGRIASANLWRLRSCAFLFACEAMGAC